MPEIKRMLLFPLHNRRPAEPGQRCSSLESGRCSRIRLLVACSWMVLIFLGGCMSLASTPAPAAAELRYLALGDSYTIGEGVAEAERWPVQLATRLHAGGVPVAPPEIIARTGWTTDELQAALQAAAPQGPYDLVTLLIGVNNQYRGYELETYRQELRQLIASAVELAGNHPDRVVVLSIPDWGVTPFANTRDREQIAREINTYNALKEEETQAAGVRFVDITDISRQAAEKPALLAADGLHPSAEMYRLWVDRLYPQIVALLAAE
jgi:lysophospholipase L1-like esterase